MTPSHAKPLLILKVGSTHPHIAEQLQDFEHWIQAGLQDPALPVTVVDPREGQALPAPAEIAGVVVTGSHSMVSDREPWSEWTAAWLREAVAADLPVLGICYGHQLLAHALGGEVNDHPQGIELGTVPVTLNATAQDDPLFAGLPEHFDAQAAHRQSVRRLPEGATLLAGNSFEPHHAFRAGPRAWGVQFHPEFGEAATRAYLSTLTGSAPDGAVRPTEIAASLLPRFARIVRG
ncbi:glutamine amidotransferase [Hydrogenophaga sp. OTU3427]|uniref:glutamine amidotransferase n=1 Tax=Hydrogenophaga sp. OTU3427 TaxID=3043856 RepID=UPI00313DB922